MFIVLLFSAQVSAQPVDQPATEIVVTAGRTAEEKAATAASADIVDRERIEKLGSPLLDNFLRLTPSASVASSGPAGSLTEVRIRGAEANHSLLFIDGIRANDPASGNTPRFELLGADIASRLEVVRGPQSALWGSEAIGGVIAVNGLSDQAAGQQAIAEAGSNGFHRAGVSAGVKSEAALLAAAIGWQRATGIDSFDGAGDRDGYRNLSARLRGTWDAAPSLELGLSAFLLDGRSEFDGVDLVTFVRADTLDSTRNRLAAGRLWARFGSSTSGLGGVVATSLLRSSNLNLLDSEEINRTRGQRWIANGQLEYRFATGAIAHTAIVALDHDRERFEGRDLLYGGASNQDRQRSHDAITGEWRAQVHPVVLDIALRHDRFSNFGDSTTLRASALVELGAGLSVAASYGEGIAQPTFFDLYGFFPGNFVGNDALRPESSRGMEVSLRYRRKQVEAALTVFRQRLNGEIVNVFDPVTFRSTAVNRSAVSRRSGVEAELGWALGAQLRLTANYAYLRASEPDSPGMLQLRETRRPKHSGSIALDGASGLLTYGASVAYAGARSDTDFDVFPARPVRLGAYWLAGARVGYQLRPGIELFARGSNLLDQSYQDVFGYRTEGRALFAGIRLAGGR